MGSTLSQIEGSEFAPIRNYEVTRDLNKSIWLSTILDEPNHSYIHTPDGTRIID